MLKKMMMLVLVAGGLAGCATVETSTRNAPLDLPGLAPGAVTVERDYALAGVRVTVPADLRVSERNVYYPLADIVWRGDPVGDRHAQVAELFRTAADRAGTQMTGNRPVAVDITLVRFHGVTERTRFSVGGVYHFVFDMTVRDAVTGAVIEPTRRMEETLAAPGGQAAVELERIGQTEKVRVTDFLTFVLHRALTGAAPGEGYDATLVARAEGL